MGSDGVVEKKRKRSHQKIPKGKKRKSDVIFKFPGQRRFTSGGPYSLRQEKDPRLGQAERARHFFLANSKPMISEGYEKKEYIRSDVDPSKFTKSELETEKAIDSLLEHLKATYTPEMRRAHMERLKKSYDDWVDNEAENLQRMDYDCAQAAITYYNKHNGTDYELVETLGSYSECYVGVWYHCNFKAQCKGNLKSGRRPSPKLFFAELCGDLIVKSCCILDGPGSRPHIVRGCQMCPGQLMHPVGGFEVGCESDSDN